MDEWVSHTLDLVDSFALVVVCVSQLFVSWCELTDWKELTGAGTLFAACFTRLLVLVRVQVVVMHVLRVVLTMTSVCVQIVATVGDKVPAGLRFVCEEHVCTIVPPQEAHDSLREFPGVTIWIFVQPVGHGTFEAISMRCNFLWELSLESWEDIIEGQSVRGEVYPARVSCKDGVSLTRPETVRLTPDTDV